MRFVFCTLVHMVVATAERRIFSEHGAAGVTRSVIRNLSEIHSRGYYHNDVSVDNIEFTDDGDAVLKESAFASRVDEPLPSVDLATTFLTSQDAAFRIVRPDLGTPNSVIERAVASALEVTEDDAACMRLIKPEEQWRKLINLDRVAIRSARIFSRLKFDLSQGRYYSSLSIADVLSDLYTDVISPRVFKMSKSFFMGFMTDASHDSGCVDFVDRYFHFDKEYRSIILAIRQLARYIAWDSVPRKEFASVILLFLELQGAAETQPFWDLMQGPRGAISQLTDFYSVPLSDTNRDALLMAWDVMHGLDPDYSQLNELLSKYSAMVAF